MIHDPRRGTAAPCPYRLDDAIAEARMMAGDAISPYEEGIEIGRMYLAKGWPCPTGMLGSAWEDSVAIDLAYGPADWRAFRRGVIHAYFKALSP